MAATKGKSKAKPKDNGSSVTSHAASKKLTDAEKKEIGFVFPYEHHKDKKPQDFAVNPATGKREGADKGLWGVTMEDVRFGIAKVVLPCLYIWEKGTWLSDIDPFDQPIKKLKIDPPFNPKQDYAWHVWVTHGEGSPGDYVFRCYLVPPHIANEQVPKHPLLWGAEYHTREAGRFQGDVASRWKANWNAKTIYHDSWELLDKGTLKVGGYQLPNAPATTKAISSVPKPAAAPALPVGVRFRCGMCGHWFKEGDLKAHNTAGICPGKEGGTTDWAVMCDKECGCTTLDQAASCKPGFPRITTKVEGGEAVSTVEEAPTPEPEQAVEGETPEPVAEPEEVASGDVATA